MCGNLSWKYGNLDDNINGNDLEDQYENFLGRYLSQLASDPSDKSKATRGGSLDKAQVKITIIIIGTLVFLFKLA